MLRSHNIIRRFTEIPVKPNSNAAASFKHVKQRIEDPQRLLLGVQSHD